jgi:hypothetical protein
MAQRLLIYEFVYLFDIFIYLLQTTGSCFHRKTQLDKRLSVSTQATNKEAFSADLTGDPD